ncbi:MAG: hypothetical protein AAFW46_11575 [Pseudomonadota bacterium]
MFNSIKWKIIGLLLAAVGSSAAGGFAFETILEKDWFSRLLEDPEKLGATSGSVILLPILFLILSGVQSYLVSVAVLAAASTAGLMYLGVDTPLQELLIVTGVGSAVAVLLYRIVT